MHHSHCALSHARGEGTAKQTSHCLTKRSDDSIWWHINTGRQGGRVYWWSVVSALQNPLPLSSVRPPPAPLPLSVLSSEPSPCWRRLHPAQAAHVLARPVPLVSTAHPHTGGGRKAAEAGRAWLRARGRHRPWRDRRRMALEQAGPAARST
eukprot:6173557-Pleurochrysis_carterae.AAC.2